MILNTKLSCLILVAVVGKGLSAGGKCDTTDDCVAPNVCSKWGWCQWTKIYGEEGPSQGSSAPGAGRAGQCKTSADCASRVPYCSDLGYCHGGTLPFDEAQLDIEESVLALSPEERPIGYINNNIRKNSPVFSGGNGNGNRKTNTKSQNKSSKLVSQSSQTNNRNGSNQAQNNKRKNQGQSRNRSKGTSSSNTRKTGSSDSGQGGCPGSLQDCVNDCVPLEKLVAYTACVKVCGKRCNE